MRSFDKYLKKRLLEEHLDIPDTVKNDIEHTLQSLPEMETCRKPSFRCPQFVKVTAIVAFITLFLLPNVSLTYAKVVGKIPFIGDIVRVVTIRNYYYSDEKHEMDIKVPKIENENSNAFTPINREIQKLTDILLKQFNQDLEQIGNKGHSSIYADYSVVTNTDTWFTLRIQVVQAAGSGSTTYKYYHLNKLTGKVITLDDIAMNEEFYKIVEKEIEKQMLEKKEKNSNLVYWVQDDTFGDCVSIDPQHNYYWDSNGNLVIPFDKYEVAPGFMGTPEFTVSKEIIKNYMKKEFNDIF